MAYEQPTVEGDTGNSGMGQPNPGGDSSMGDQDQGGYDESQMVHLPAEYLPPGVDAKEGTRLTLCIMGPPDQDGDVPCCFENSEPDADDQQGQTSWEDDFLQHMSPRSGESEQQQEPM